MSFGDTIIGQYWASLPIRRTPTAPPTPLRKVRRSIRRSVSQRTRLLPTATRPVDYSLSADSSGGGFKIDPNTGVVTVADPSKIDFESAPGHAYTITVRATKNNNFSSEQNFTISVNNVAPSTPVNSNAAANTVLEGAANGTAVGITASSIDINGRGVTYSLTGDTSRRRLHHQCHNRRGHRADGSKIDFESSAGHVIPSPCSPATAR